MLSYIVFICASTSIVPSQIVLISAGTKNWCLVRLCLSVLALKIVLSQTVLICAGTEKLCLVRQCLSVLALKIVLICVDYAGEDHNDDDVDYDDDDLPFDRYVK